MTIHEGKSLKAFLDYYAIPKSELHEKSGFARSTLYLDFEKKAIDGDHKESYIRTINAHYREKIKDREGRVIAEEEINEKFIFRFGIESLDQNRKLFECMKEKEELKKMVRELTVAVNSKTEQIGQLIEMLSRKEKAP